MIKVLGWLYRPFLIWVRFDAMPPTYDMPGVFVFRRLPYCRWALARRYTWRMSRDDRRRMYALTRM
jgi:hypothetical protein